MILKFPWPKRELSPNARVHHFALARAKKAYRAGCGWEARTQGGRHIDAERVAVTITFHPPDRRRRDDDNIIASFKAGRDGIADVIGIDDSKWTTTYHIAPPIKHGLVVVEIKETEE